MFATLFNILSSYTDKHEKSIDRFFNKLSSRSDKAKVRKQTKLILQKDTIRASLLVEYKFKKYKTLKKSYRKKLYKNAELIKNDFLHYWESNHTKLRDTLKLKKLSGTSSNDEGLLFCFAIMQYLHPKLKYRAGSAFEKLLRKPNKEMMVGDCNQIVTLYIALYSLKHNIQDLKLKLLPDHVCLYYKGIDIETTRSQFAKYTKHKGIVEVEEIIPINMLDISDHDEARFEVSPKRMKKAAEIAFLLSSHKELVEKNLKIAYHNLGIHYLKDRNYSDAESCFKFNDDAAALRACYGEAVQYFLEKKKYSNALRYATKSGNPKLKSVVIQNQAVDLLKHKKFDDARSKFRLISDVEGVRVCDQNELHYLSQKIKHCQTISDYKKYKSTIRKMEKLARKLENREVGEFCKDILSQKSL